MKHVAFALALALTPIGFLACTSGGSEDDAYDLVKSRAANDLNCSDITVKKMAQDGASYEYQATGCEDIYTYAVDCGSRCEITAGVRGRGLGGLWNAADNFISGIAKDIEAADKRHEEMRARHDKMREENDEFRRRVRESLERSR